MNIKIEKMRQHEINKVAQLFNLYRMFYQQEDDYQKAKEFIEQRFKNNESEIFIAKDQSKYLGMMQLYPFFSSVRMQKIWVLNDLYIHQDARGQGLGKLFLEQAKKFALETDARAVILETTADNHIAQKLYEKFGFKREDDTWHYRLSL